MAYTGNIIYLNGVIPPERFGLRVEGEIGANYGSYYGLLSAVDCPDDGYVPRNDDDIRVHVYRDGLLIHIMKPRGSWYSPEYEGAVRFSHRLHLKLED